MDSVQIVEIISDLGKKKDPYYKEFLRKQSMSAGIYALPKGSIDEQEPHSEDELYFVLKGKAQIEINGRSQPVSHGSAIFVAAGVPHRFKTIEQDLMTLVVFSPAEETGL
jgi:mannose-6-phosphate isomerase-like protein (cupin superfamily)